MGRLGLILLASLLVFLSGAHGFASAQTAAPSTSTLRAIRIEGAKQIAEEQIIALSGLQAGAEIHREDLQSAADRLVQTGLFANVKYSFQSKPDGVAVTFTLEEAPRIPVFYDNFPWLDDSELNEAVRKKFPFFDGKLPPAGSVVDDAASAITALISARGIEATLEHQVLANPIGDGDVQEFHLQGAGLKIASITFSDPALTENKGLRQHLSEISGTEYSRTKIDLFLFEQVRPIYFQRGNLHAKLGPPEVRLSGNPNEKMPKEIPIFVPVSAGPVYRWKGIQWDGNSALSDLTLTVLMGLKPGEIADGMAIENGWDRVREEYGHRGFLDAKLDAVASYDESAHTVSYTVTTHEGPAYRMGAMVLTGLSPTAERRLHESWLTPSGGLFDKAAFEELLTKLQTHREKVFGELPVHYDNVGHWLQTDPVHGTVDILLDFK
jgi:surface antigen-like variable number repeat protein